jgi:hypothetical protein
MISIAGLAYHIAMGQVLYGSWQAMSQTHWRIRRPCESRVVNTGTGASTSTLTDERGAFTFNNLQAGIYKVTITAAPSRLLSWIRFDRRQLRPRLDAELRLVM